jgi:hypothetical protein
MARDNAEKSAEPTMISPSNRCLMKRSCTDSHYVLRENSSEESVNPEGGDRRNLAWFASSIHLSEEELWQREKMPRPEVFPSKLR